MYEFTKKEIREKFKNTEYGKKVNRMLNISLIIFVIIALIPVVVSFAMGFADYKIDDRTFDLCYNIYMFIFYIVVIDCIYFDGKRDGAIEQFKRSIKPNKDKK